MKRIKLPDEVAEDFCNLLQKNATVAVPGVLSPNVCRDPKDIDLLGLSESGKAGFLVTGDKDLTESGWQGNARIVTPRQFWEVCREG